MALPSIEGQHSGARVMIQLLVDTSESLNLLQNLSDLMHFKTEVKKKPGVPEDTAGMEQEEKARRLSSKVLHLIVTEMYTVPLSIKFCEHFANIPAIMNSCCEVSDTCPPDCRITF